MRKMPVTPEAADQFDLTSFLEREATVGAEVRETHIRANLELFSKFRPIDASTRIFEVGIGSGWFQVMCLRRGIECEGIELTPQLASRARELGKQYGVEPKIQLGNI